MEGQNAKTPGYQAGAFCLVLLSVLNAACEADATLPHIDLSGEFIRSSAVRRARELNPSG